MESTNNNNSNQLLSLSEFKELRNEISSMKKRIDQLERSHEKQQERLDILERENHALKKETELNVNGNKAVGSVLKRKRTDQVHEKETESKPPASGLSSVGKKKTKTKKNNNKDEVVVILRRDNGDSFDSLSDDLLHKIVEFDGNCYSKFGSINKRCRNIYDVKEYKLRKQTCLYGYGTVAMMLQHCLQKRKKGKLGLNEKAAIAIAVVKYNRLDAVDLIIKLGDGDLLDELCCYAAFYGRINILTKVFCNFSLTVLEEVLDDVLLCYNAAENGQLETLKWLRNHGAKWDGGAFDIARSNGHDEVVQYLRLEGCLEQDEESDESSGSD